MVFTTIEVQKYIASVRLLSSSNNSYIITTGEMEPGLGGRMELELTRKVW